LSVGGKLLNHKNASRSQGDVARIIRLQNGLAVRLGLNALAHKYGVTHLKFPRNVGRGQHRSHRPAQPQNLRITLTGWIGSMDTARQTKKKKETRLKV
jgi:hypothetical protein